MHLYHHIFNALGGTNEIKLYATSAEIARSSCLMLEAEVRQIVARYSRYRADSIVSLINSSAGLDPVSVDDETAGLLDYAAICFQESKGLFDITSGILRRAWNFKEARVPTIEDIAPLLALVNWQLVEWTRPLIRLTKPGMEIDFGGLGKEYAADRVASRALSIGITQGMINLAGDIRILGPHPDGSPWHIGVTHPRGESQPITAVALSTGAVATSGDYERYFEVAGKRYCHILNPRTGYPVQGFQSVTVVADSCLVAGSISTISMLFEEERGLTFLRDSSARFIAVKRNGVVVRSAR